MKFKKHYAGPGGWSEWSSPTPKKPYKFACCDCSLVHDIELRAISVEERGGGWWSDKGPLEGAHRVLLRARRNERLTRQLRANNGTAP